MKKRKQVDLSYTIPSNPTDTWFSAAVVMYFYDRYNAVELYQKTVATGAVQHLMLTPTNYINFTERLKQAGFKNKVLV